MELYSKIEGTGKPLLILHGFLGMSDNWKTLGTRFATDGFEVHMLDLRNHGRSPHSENFTYHDMSDDIKKYCDARALPRVSVIGHSMGGKAAMFFAAYNPNIVDKLVIADIGPQYYRPHHQDILAGLNAVDFTQVRDRSDVEEVLSAHIPEFGTRQFLMKSLYRKTPTSFDFRFNLKVFNEQIENIGIALPMSLKYDQPVLFIRGGNSRYILEEDYTDIRQQFPQARFETIPGAGHWLHAEKPAEFYEVCSNFLK